MWCVTACADTWMCGRRELLAHHALIRLHASTCPRLCPVLPLALEPPACTAVGRTCPPHRPWPLTVSDTRPDCSPCHSVASWGSSKGFPCFWGTMGGLLIVCVLSCVMSPTCASRGHLLNKLPASKFLTQGLFLRKGLEEPVPYSRMYMHTHVSTVSKGATHSSGGESWCMCVVYCMLDPVLHT